MEEKIKEGESTPKKLTYEELENVAKQLSEQNRLFYQELQKREVQEVFTRLGFLFKVVEFANRFSSDFLKKCVSEIESLITIPEETTEEQPTENK